MVTNLRNLLPLRKLPFVFAAAATVLVFACLIAGDDPPHSIFYFASKGDLAAVKEKVEQDPDLVRQTKGGGLTPLHYAAQNGQIKVIDYLVEHGAEVDTRTTRGRTSLHEAANYSWPEAVERLIALGADVHARDYFNSTPLHIAAGSTWSVTGEDDPPDVAQRRLDVVKRLIASKAEIIAQDNRGCTPLHCAAEDNQAAVIEYLVSQGAEIDARTNGGYAPLHLAAGSPHGAFEAVRVLVRLGADPAARLKRDDPRIPAGQSVLAGAATWGHLDIVKFLLEQEAPVRYDDGAGRTALQHALTGWRLVPEPDDPQAIADRVAVIDLLAEQIDFVNPETGKFDRGILLGVALKNHMPAAVRYLLENDPSISADDIDKALNLKGIPLPDNPRARQQMRNARERLRAARDAKHQAQSAGTPDDAEFLKSVEAVKPSSD